MNTINADRQPFSQSYDFLAFNAVSKSAQTTQVTATSQQQKDITVYTREGDKVTLTYDARIQIDYSNYQGQFNQVSAVGVPNAAALELQSAAVQQETVALTGDRTFAITIEGDLSDQELNDIKTILQQIDGVMMDALGSGLSQAPAEGLSIGDLDTLTGVEARYYQASTVAVQQTSYRESDAIAVAQAPRDTQALDNQDTEAAKNTAARLERLIKDSRVKPGHLVRPLKGYFNNIFRQFSNAEHHGHRSSRLARRIGNDLINRLSTPE